MSLSLDRIDKTVNWIDELVAPLSDRYGRLLNWQNPPDPFWHYGIGLSDTHIFDTGRGLRPFERNDAKFVLGIENLAFEPNQTIKRLKYALRVFADWEYTLPGWNCEHLGRLIATDQPRCYQSRPIWWLCNLTPYGDHKTTHQMFQNYLNKIDKSLVQRKNLRLS